jgi:hypothetical protein
MIRWRRTPTRDRSSDETVICLQVEIMVPAKMREAHQAEADQQGVSLESVIADSLFRPAYRTTPDDSVVPDETENRSL